MTPPPPPRDAAAAGDDAAAIARRIATVDFPWDTTRALELALFRTFASPRIGGLLAATGEFTQRPQKRYDDTDLIVSEIVEHGYDSERGRRAIARMNALHGRFAIRNEDFLYVLSTFVCEPIRWNARFGWRPMTEAERLGWFRFWRAVGARMGLADLPESLDACDAFNRAYEAAELRPSRAGAAVGEATRAMFAAWFPRPLRPLVRRAVPAMLDPPLRAAFGWPAPARWLPPTLAVMLRLRAHVARRLPSRPVYRTALPRAAYPNGYRIESLGPPGG
jgi:hypothetical protein